MIQKIHLGVENLVFRALCSTKISVCLKVAYIGLSFVNHYRPCTALDILTTLVGSIC